jgi:hypothetical protein
MGKQNNRSSGAGEVQIFELTMDNLEDQDELNRRLRKPGEPERCTPTKPRATAQGESATEMKAKDARRKK